MTFLIFIAVAVGVVGLYVEARAVRAILRTRVFATRTRIWSAFLLLLGVPLAFVGSTLAYSPSPDLKVIGVPFPVAAFEQHGGRWSDFTGPLPLPAAVGNFVFLLLLPQLGLWLWTWQKARVS